MRDVREKVPASVAAPTDKPSDRRFCGVHRVFLLLPIFLLYLLRLRSHRLRLREPRHSSSMGKVNEGGFSENRTQLWKVGLEFCRFATPSLENGGPLRLPSFFRFLASLASSFYSLHRKNEEVTDGTIGAKESRLSLGRVSRAAGGERGRGADSRQRIRLVRPSISRCEMDRAHGSSGCQTRKCKSEPTLRAKGRDSREMTQNPLLIYSSKTFLCTMTIHLFKLA